MSLGYNALKTMHGGVESGIWVVPALAIRYVYWLKKETMIDKNRATTACSFAVMLNEAPLTQLSGEMIYA
ncbi:hypothetical protein [Symbiopectobacterium purcellii]|uniref:hypothetical protein n=1 Tax=Symbiopectobacterium purcellii TaxID=2871826 RepID=UPI003F8431EE